MNKTLKRLLIGLLIVALLGGGLWGGLLYLGSRQRKPVNVYALDDIVMTGYWGDTSEASGMVTTTGLQSVYISDTQQITEIYVREGQEIQEGDKVLAFDTTLTDIELEKAKLNLEKLKLKLENVKKEQEYVNGLRPFAMILVTPPEKEIVLVPEPTPQIVQGRGTETDPFIILWNRGSGLTVPYLESLFPQAPEDGEDGEAAPEEPAEEPAEEPEEEPEEDPDPVDPNRIYAKFMVRDSNAMNGQVLDSWGLILDRYNGFSFRVVDGSLPAELYDYDVQEEPYYKAVGSSYTAKELEQMRQDKEQEVKDTAREIEMAQVELQRLEREMSDGVVLSKLTGVVKAVRDPEEARSSGQPVVELSAGGGYYVKIAVGELDRDRLEIGQTVTVQSWENYGQYEGSIVEIGESPSESGQGWSNGNQNVSWYDAKVFVEESANLREYEYVNVSYNAGQSAGEEDAWYLQNMFILSEGGVSYVYVKGADGLLEKRVIQTGKSVWGEYTQIRGGLELSDRIAFPYGKDVGEGAETVDAEIQELYSSVRYY